MAKGARSFPPINVQYFQGGMSVSKKLGVANSFFDSKNLDFRTDPSQISVLPAPAKLTNTSGLITAMDQDLNGVRWAVDTVGNIGRINTSNAYSVVATMTEAGSAGLLYNQLTDQLYVPGQTSISMYGKVTSTVSGPRYQSNVFGKSASNANGCTNLFNSADGLFDGTARNNAPSLTAGITTPSMVTTVTATSTYGVPATLSETPGNYCYFAPDIEPGYSIAVNVAAIGTGNWTLTLHDSSNNLLATTTITHANMVVGYNEFVFSSQVRVLVNASQSGSSATYHFHLTSTVADGTVNCVTASDLSSADFLWFAARLVNTNNGWHPTALFTGTGKPLLCVGNGNYLATYDFSNDAGPSNAQFQRHQLQFKHGYEVCGVTSNNQYLVVAVERRSTNASRSFQDGALYFWSGSNQSAPDFVIDIPMGAPYSIQNVNNIVYFYVAGSLYAWSGGQTVIKVRKMAYQNTDYLGTSDSTIVNPNMIGIRYNMAMLGYPSSSNNVGINYGVYSWGALELTFPSSFGYSYTASNGFLNNNTSGITNLQIGCVYNFVDTMYLSWSYTQGGTTYYGIDMMDNTSAAALTASWESLIFDGSARYKLKLVQRLKISFIALPTGCTITPYYKLDRGAQVNGTAVAAGSVQALMDINLRFHEISYGFTVTCPAGTLVPPVITGVSIEIDPLTDEYNISSDG